MTARKVCGILEKCRQHVAIGAQRHTTSSIVAPSGPSVSAMAGHDPYIRKIPL
jgi:hypothetical protein